MAAEWWSSISRKLIPQKLISRPNTARVLYPWKQETRKFVDLNSIKEYPEYYFIFRKKSIDFIDVRCNLIEGFN